MSDRPDPGQLAEAIKGMSDEQLAGEIASMGVDDVLTMIFEGMQAAFVPERAQGVSATIQYDIRADTDVKRWTVTVADGACRAEPGPAASPRLTLDLGLVDFVRLIFNQVQGPQLFMSGKLKLKGDMMFAMQMQNLFRREFA